MAIHLGLQLVIPFRHLFYPGVVHWTEEGHRWSWHMKLRSKDCRGAFFVTDPVSGATTLVKPQRYLAEHQDKMLGRPDMILQFAHFLREYQRSIADPDGFWGEQAQRFLWERKWQRVLDWEGAQHQWFVGGKLNVTVNALDRHASSERKNRVAYLWLGEDGSEMARLTTDGSPIVSPLVLAGDALVAMTSRGNLYAWRPQ